MFSNKKYNRTLTTDGIPNKILKKFNTGFSDKYNIINKIGAVTLAIY